MKEIVDKKTLKELLAKSTKILLVTRERPSIDGLASLLALGRSLKENNKTVFLACSAQIPPEAGNLPGIENIAAQLQDTNLVISFDYVEGMVEKVSYNIDGDQFNLILTGKESSIDPKKILFKSTGADFDLIILVDTPKVEYLGKLLEHDQDLYSKLPSVNIDYHPSNTGHSTYKWVNSDEGSTSEIVLDIITNLEFPLSKESAGLILTGIKAATNNFEKTVNAETFERAARCLRVLGQVEEKEEVQSQSPDESWFAPKIYRSSKIIE